MLNKRNKSVARGRKAAGKRGITNKSGLKSQGMVPGRSEQRSTNFSASGQFNLSERDCPVCGSRNVHYNKVRAELICRECGEIHAQIV